MTRPFRLAGIIAGLVLIGFGAGAIVIGLQGRSEINTTIQREHIVGSDDMSPALIAVATKKAGLDVALPTCDVAGKAISSGADAKCFAAYVRIHALEGAGGKTYSQMERSDPARETWISATALTTALNTSYFASSVATFAIVMGIALLLTGTGFIVLCAGLLGRSRPVKKPVVQRVAHELRTN